MAACPFLTGLWTFRCLARTTFVIPTITEETRYCLSKHPDRCPHYPGVKPDIKAEKVKDQVMTRVGRNSKSY
ncbi:MAG: hypothetical protein V1694_09385 [Candidatus Eisenbacteria bacterium]|jgi:hypothetical protein